MFLRMYSTVLTPASHQPGWGDVLKDCSSEYGTNAPGRLQWLTQTVALGTEDCRSEYGTNPMPQGDCSGSHNSSTGY